MTGGHSTEGPNERIARLEERANASDRRTEESNQRMNRLEDGQHRMDGRIDKLFYTVIALLTGAIGWLVAAQIAD